MRFAELWRNLRQRRIIQILIAYLAGGWVALEAIDQLVNNDVFPLLAYRLTLVLFLAGIPAALIIGWYHGEKGVQRVSKTELGLLGLVVAAGLAAVVAVIQASERPTYADEIAAELDPRRLAVLYFDDATAGEDLQYLADGLTEELIDQLSRVPSLSVISRNGAAQFRDSGLPLDSIARLLNAGTIIRGSVEKTEAKLRVQVRLADGGSGEEFQRETFERPTEELLTVQAGLASEVSRLLREWLGEEVRLRERRAGTENVAAWVLVQRAERATKQAEHRLGGDAVEEAVALYHSADSLLAQAEAVDTAWVAPIVLRGWVAYERSWLVHDAHEALRWLDEASSQAQRALARQSKHARALELRGTARYRRWLLGAETDPVRAGALLNAAREDLEAAARLESILASPYATLSHLYYQPGAHQDVTSAVLAARRAYEQDAYLRAADGVLWRLYSGSYDLENYAQAKRWCELGHRRFPDEFRFMECQLWLLTMEASEPDVEQAWNLLREMEELVPEPQKEYYLRGARMVVGGVIARAGLERDHSDLLDSARRVMERARAGPEVDPEQELLSIEAIMRVILGDEDVAMDLLKRYEAANPGHFSTSHGSLHWWWRDLQDNPEFQRLRAAGH